jgi:hypothetical protein
LQKDVTNGDDRGVNGEDNSCEGGIINAVKGGRIKNVLTKLLLCLYLVFFPSEWFIGVCELREGPSLLGIVLDEDAEETGGA